MTIIKITGGIGSGKSVMGGVLKERGEVVFDADEIVKEITAVRPQLRPARPQEIFKDKKALAALEDKLHPLVFADLSKKIAASRAERVFVLVPALKRFAADFHFDKTVTVAADMRIRVDRVKARSGLTETEIAARMAEQDDDVDLIKRSDAVIFNNGGKEEFTGKIIKTSGAL